MTDHAVGGRRPEGHIPCTSSGILSALSSVRELDYIWVVRSLQVIAFSCSGRKPLEWCVELRDVC